MSDFSSIGLRIKDLRKSKNLSQEDFVKDLGISRAALSQIESNTINLSLELLTKIVSKYNVSADWIIYGIDNKISSYSYKSSEPSSIIREKKEIYNNTHPPGCETCKEKDKLIASQQATIQALQRASNTQTEYIESLKEKIEELAEPGEKKRKAS